MSTTLERPTLGTPHGYSTISSTRSGYSIDGGTAKRQPRFIDSPNSITTPDKMATTSSCSCYRYNFAIVSRIAGTFVESSSFDLAEGKTIDLDKARREHEELVEALRRIGLDVIELPCDDKHPDGLFVDDIAVVINGTALICNPKPMKDKPSRQGEVAVVRQVLRKEIGLKIVEVDSEKAYVEGGDVLWTGREIFVGISERTNRLGALAVAKAFPEYPTTTIKVHPPAAHLKSYISLAGPEILVVARSEAAQKTFQEIKNSGSMGYKYISVEEEEAANVIYCNNTLVHLNSNQIPKSLGTFENRIDFPRVAVGLEEPLKRSGRLGSCVLLIARISKPKKIPSTLP